MTDYRRMRGNAGLADLQNWTRFDLSGPQAGNALDAVVGCNVRDLFEGRAANTLIPSPTGGVDAVVWVIALEDGFRIVAEPADHEAIRAALTASTSGRDAVLSDIGGRTFALVLAGPEAETVAWKAFGDEIRSLAFLNVMRLGDRAVLAARIGYFGEYELHLFGDLAGKRSVIDALKQAGDGDALMVGEGAFPAMMTEMGTMSRERDIPPEASVFEAGLHWMVDFRKENLRAAGELARRKHSVERKCVLMIVDGVATGLRGKPVFIEDCDIGSIQSAFHSETLGRCVALAYIAEDFAMPGLTCFVGTGRQLGTTVSAPAFLGRSILDNPS